MKLLRLLLVPIFLVGLALLPAPAQADHCNAVVIEISGVMYIENRGGGGAGEPDWIYLETNGEAGLQSGGYHGWDPAHLFNTDPCDHPNPDFLVY